MREENTERVLGIGSAEYRNMEKLVEILNVLSPNGIRYMMCETYMDIGAGIKWTTIRYEGKFGGVQILYPVMWDRVVKAKSPIEILEVAKTYFSDRFCSDV